jgi:cold shock protein
MKLGVIQWFNSAMAFGFILPSDGTKELFFHRSDVEGVDPFDGMVVSYELVRDAKGRPAAVQIVAVDEDEDSD